ncbi:phosphoenolpyruvate synthase [Nocardia sp. BMG51109]|uniref:phosphoenolpyruvate synthase n=1 Tax=Nocardia sp. BMG51109 TaxID=1056816 RepID=UPI0004ACCFDA|nr:phosphoenolpyruvate synthase [Nocardia sp. BMG51109]
MHVVQPEVGDADTGGGKARGLRRLRAAGFRVPDWVVLESDLFEHVDGELVSAAAEFATTSDLDEALRRGARLRERLVAAQLPPEAAERIRAACELLGDVPIAVRSSAEAEDGAGYSFAGQFDSFLNRRGVEAVGAAVRECWASAFAERVIRYAFAHDLPLPGVPAVVVQRLVEARSSGVLFTANPTTGAPGELVIGAVYGLGEGLVSGAVDADSLVVDKVSGTVVESVLGEKATAYLPDGAGGCAPVPVDAQRSAAAVLSDEAVAELAGLGRRVEEALGAPQDIEWAADADGLWVLQARPITTPISAPLRGAGEHLAPDESRIWDNSNILESFNGLTSPLTFTTAADIYGRVYRGYARSLRVPGPQLRQTDAWTGVLLGSFHGRVYYNLLHWYRMVGIAPGYPLNRRVLEAALGVEEPLPDDLAKTLRPFTFANPAARLWSRAVTTVTYLRRIAGIDAMMERFLTEFYRVYDEFDAVDDAALTGERAYARYRELDRELVRRWGPMMVLDAILLTLTGLLYVLTKLLLPKAPEWFLYAMAGPGEDVESAEPARAMAAMAEAVRADPGLRRIVESSAPERARADLEAAGRTEFLSLVDDYIVRYGYRSIDELKLETPDLREDPASLFVLLRGALPQEQTRRGGEAEAYLDEHLHGVRRRLYDRLRRKVGRCAAHRERLRFCRTRAFGMVKRMIRVMGRDLAARGVIDDFADVFFLTVTELRGCYEGADTAPLRGLVEARKRQRATDSRLVAPSRFVTHGAGFGRAELAEQGWVPVADMPAATAGAVLSGTPSGSGVGTGPAVVVDEPRDVAGGVLVTYRTDPGWVAALPSAAALVIERGSPLTHVAIVARELGVPTVVQVRDATTKLRTGMPIRVDGTTGTVTVLAEGDAPDAG